MSEPRTIHLPLFAMIAACLFAAVSSHAQKSDDRQSREQQQFTSATQQALECSDAEWRVLQSKIAEVIRLQQRLGIDPRPRLFGPLPRPGETVKASDSRLPA